MSKIIDRVGDKYLCPVTQKTENVIIQNTTTRHEASAVQKETAFPVTKNLKYCSGLDACGVMKSQDDNFSFTWDRCPLKATL